METLSEEEQSRARSLLEEINGLFAKAYDVATLVFTARHPGFAELGYDAYCRMALRATLGTEKNRWSEEEEQDLKVPETLLQEQKDLDHESATKMTELRTLLFGSEGFHGIVRLEFNPLFKSPTHVCVESAKRARATGGDKGKTKKRKLIK